jgi:hypothetical protein
MVNNCRAAVIGALLILSLLLLFSCGPKPEIPREPKYQAPTISGLKTVRNNGNSSLIWEVDRKADDAFGGYDIFVTTSLNRLEESIKPLNVTRYPGDTDGEIKSDSYSLEAVSPGEIYYAWVKAYSMDGSVFSVSDTVTFSPMLEGKIYLSLRYSNSTSGYDLARSKYVPGRSPKNDIIFMAGRGEPKLYSPSRLDNSFRKSYFAELPQSASFEYLEEFNPDDFSWDTSVSLQKGQAYLIKTAESRYAKLLCIDITGEGGRQNAVLKYVFSPVVNYTKFH